MLQVTGRDVMEAEYALTFHEGSWSLDGDTLGDARDNVARRADAAALGDCSAHIIEFVRQRPGPTPAADITGKFGGDAASYLRRLVDSQRLTRVKRGLYAVPVSEVSEVSETQVNEGAETDTPGGGGCQKCQKRRTARTGRAAHHLHTKEITDHDRHPRGHRRGADRRGPPSCLSRATPSGLG